MINTKFRQSNLFATLLLLIIWLPTYGQTFDTEYTYTDSTGRRILVQNSFPKGGLPYSDSSGKENVYSIFWTRIVNESKSTLELQLNFPADSFPIPSNFATFGTYVNLLLPPDTMKPEKDKMFNYGLSDIKSFLDTSLHQPSVLKKTIRPKETCLFYVVVLANQGIDGSLRAGVDLKSKDIILYKINGIAIRCGQFGFKPE